MDFLPCAGDGPVLSVETVRKSCRTIDEIHIWTSGSVPSELSHGFMTRLEPGGLWRFVRCSRRGEDPAWWAGRLVWPPEPPLPPATLHLDLQPRQDG